MHYIKAQLCKLLGILSKAELLENANYNYNNALKYYEKLIKREDLTLQGLLICNSIFNALNYFNKFLKKEPFDIEIIQKQFDTISLLGKFHIAYLQFFGKDEFTKSFASKFLSLPIYNPFDDQFLSLELMPFFYKLIEKKGAQITYHCNKFLKILSIYDEKLHRGDIINKSAGELFLIAGNAHFRTIGLPGFSRLPDLSVDYMINRFKNVTREQHYTESILKESEIKKIKKILKKLNVEDEIFIKAVLLKLNLFHDYCCPMHTLLVLKIYLDIDPLKSDIMEKQKPICTNCGNILKILTSFIEGKVFGYSFDPTGVHSRYKQYEGAICERCHTILCDDCFSNTGNSYTCTQCGSKLKPCFSKYL